MWKLLPNSIRVPRIEHGETGSTPSPGGTTLKETQLVSSVNRIIGDESRRWENVLRDFSRVVGCREV